MDKNANIKPNVRVYAPDGVNFLGNATRASAREWVAEGLARWADRCRAINLTTLRPLRGHSATMGPAVILANARGLESARIVTAAWRTNKAEMESINQ